MGTKISFGECLKQLLLIREWSASRLAREINIEPSYVRMWIRGERTPAIQSDHVKMIAVALTEGLDSSSKKSVFDSYLQYFEHMGVDLSESKALSELTEQILSNAQLYSLSIKPKRKMKNMFTKERMTDPVKHNDIPSFIEGRYSILCAVLSMLRTMLTDSGPNPREITIACQGDSHLFSEYPVLYDLWVKLLTQALKRKWKVWHYYRMGANTECFFKMVEEMVEWVGYRNYFFPCFFTKCNEFYPSLEIIAAEDVGAFILIPGESVGNIDTALYIKKKDANKALFQYSSKIRRDTRFKLNYFSGFMEYSEFLALECRKKGNFYSVSPDLHFITMPLTLLKKYLSDTTTDPIKMEQYHRRISELVRVFYEDVNRFKMKLICQIEILEWMAEEQDYFFRYYYQKATAEDILLHFEHTLHLLKTYPNFEIALVSEKHNNVTLPMTSWDVRGGSNVGMVTVDMEEHTNFVYLAITEETVAGAFNDYFLDLWDKITPKYKDKSFVISWFEEKTQHLRENISIA